MAEQRITDLSSIDAVALTDVVHVVDTSDTTSTVDGTSKKATISQVKTSLSIPSTTSDLAEGTNKYYTEARVAANSAVAANTAKVTNATHTGDVTGSGALTIANDVVTNAKLANVATNTIKGRVTATTGDPEDLTAAQVRTLLNVEDGATADQTAGEIKTAYESNPDTNAYTDSEKTKLGTVETNADVTDITNVTAAGALMDSEVTNLAQVKAFDSADYATAAQGTKADNAIPSSEKGANNGVAELDAGGKVPSAQLPAFVDDVLEYTDLASFPATGETGKIYVAEDTNIVYRWSGSAYVEISASLALGETSSTAYRGDRGKIAYDHSQVTTGNPHNVLATQITDFDTEVANNSAVAANTAKVSYPGSADATELNILNGATITTEELNKLDGVEGDVVGTTDTQTVSNKRNQPRTSSTTSTATLTPDLSTANVFYVTAQAAALTIAAPTGTAAPGETISIHIKDDGTSRTLTFNATYKFYGAAAPTATTVSKGLLVTAQYDGTAWVTTFAEEQ